MLDLLPDILIVFFEVFCCNIFFETFGRVRYKGWINIIQKVLMVSCVFVTVKGLSSFFIMKQLVIIIVFSAFMFWHIKIGIKKSFILAILYQALLLAVDYVAYSIHSRLFSNNAIVEKQYMLESILVILLGKAILFLCVLIIKKRLEKKTIEMLVEAEWFRFLLFPLSTIAIISAMLSTSANVEISKHTNLLLVIAFVMFGMNMLVFYLINDILEREMKLHKNRIFQMQVENQVEMYRSISENFDNQRKKTHEYKNQIVCIEALLSKKKYFELEKYVQGIYGELDKELDAINTNNAIVNAVLNTKYQEADKKGIVFVFRINDLSNIKMTDEDIVTILSNLLNNAIEACEKCDDKKIIKMKFVKEEHMIVISVKNSFSHQIRYENGEIKSSKLFQTEEHGVGINNVVRVVEKYNGSYVISDCNNEFYFSIIIPS